MDAIDLYWLPVGAGTHFQRASLLLYESILAAVQRRPRAVLCHSALKIEADGRPYTLELMPVPAHEEFAPLLTGPVGSSIAGRLRLFRYQLCLKESARLPDESWSIDSPLRLTTDPRTVGALFAVAPSTPAHVWGRRVPGTSEMWASNSTISWLLASVGIPASEIGLPPGTRAPGWNAGLEVVAAHANGN